MQNSSTQTRVHNVCIATSAKECNKKVCNLTAEVRGKGQGRSLMDGFIGLNQFKNSPRLRSTDLYGGSSKLGDRLLLFRCSHSSLRWRRNLKILPISKNKSEDWTEQILSQGSST